MFSDAGDCGVSASQGPCAETHFLRPCSKTISRALSAQEMATLGNAKYLDLLVWFSAFCPFLSVSDILSRIKGT